MNDAIHILKKWNYAVKMQRYVHLELNVGVKTKCTNTRFWQHWICLRVEKIVWKRRNGRKWKEKKTKQRNAIKRLHWISMHNNSLIQDKLHGFPCEWTEVDISLLANEEIKEHNIIFESGSYCVYMVGVWNYSSSQFPSSLSFRRTLFKNVCSCILFNEYGIEWYAYV